MRIINTNLLNYFYKKGVKPLKEAVGKKLDTSKIVNNLLTTVSGFALDARQGPVLQGQIDDINSNLSGVTFRTGLITFTTTNVGWFDCSSIKNNKTKHIILTSTTSDYLFITSCFGNGYAYHASTPSTASSAANKTITCYYLAIDY